MKMDDNWNWYLKPKERSIKEIHAIWLKTEERANRIQKDITDCVDEIIEKIPLENGKKKIYFKNQKGEIMEYIFSKTDNRWWYSSNYPETIDRKLKIYSITNDIRSTLGEKFNMLVNRRSSLSYITFNHMWNVIKDKFYKEKKLVDKIYTPSYRKINIINIDGYKYHVLEEYENGQLSQLPNFTWCDNLEFEEMNF